MMTKKDNRIILFKSLIIPLVIVPAIAFTFLHEYQPASSKRYKEHKKEYNRIIDERDSSNDKLFEDFRVNKISKVEFYQLYEFNKQKSICELNNYKSIKQEIKDEDSVLGYTSYKNYLLGIAFPLLGLLTALFLLFVIVKKVKDKSSRVIYLIANFSLIAAWGYWVSWSNLNHTQNPSRPGDFPRFYYDIALYVLPSLFFILCYFSFKNLKTIEEKIKILGNIFYTGFWRGLTERNLVNPEKKEEFKLYRLELTKKAVENE